ncbi:MAG TPA: TIR domain-containing protein [Candidatus Baltobacteraceae bacterium]|nr:TIR domain-containing protein [Candidatus Baltobacteraceae bacterium]
MHRVFISYASPDYSLADAVCRTFERAGIDCWIAPRDILPGEDWAAAIAPAIERTGIFLIVLSAHASASAEVRREVHLAQRSKKRVIPFWIDSAEPSGALQYLLAGEHRVAASDDNPEAKIGDLLERVRRIFEEPPETPIQTAPSPNNLPAESDKFVGRESEVADLRSLIRNHRLVTIAGPGGVGKTRTALQTARGMAGEFPGGVWFADLASIADSAFVPAAFESALKNADVERSLIVADNCEHLIEAVCDWLKTLPESEGVRVLCTSRQPLGVQGERVFALCPLSSPPESRRAPSLAELNQSPAARLFLDRAEGAAAALATEDGRMAVVRICRSLDGIPLALELAAARARSLSLEQIAEAIEQRFRLLTTGARDGLPHHKTLRALIDWSFELLDENRRALMLRLGVFDGRFSLDAVRRVCAPDADAFDVLDDVDRLVNQSLITIAGDVAGSRRYLLLESIRSYVRDRSRESIEGEPLKTRLAAYVREFAAELTNKEDAVPLLDAEIDNIRGALRWTLVENPQTGTAAELLDLLTTFWQTSGRWIEASRWYETAARFYEEFDPVLRAKLLVSSGVIAFYRADHDKAIGDIESSLQLIPQEDAQARARALNMLASALYEKGSHADARHFWNEALGLLERAKNDAGTAMVRSNLGMVAWQIDCDYDRAAAYYEEALTVFRRLNLALRVAQALGSLAEISYARGNLAQAIGYAAESLKEFQTLGNTSYSADRMMLLAKYHSASGQLQTASMLVRDALEEFAELDQPVEIAECAFIVADILARSNPAKAAQIYGFAESARANGRPLSSADRERRHALRYTLEQNLSADSLSGLMTQGQLMPRDAGVRFILDAIDSILDEALA